MKRETKLWIRKRALMTLRAIVWRTDDWLHGAEVRLREELAASEAVGPQRSDRDEVRILTPAQSPHQKWEARRSGVAPVSKKSCQRRRRLSAADFDRRFA
jgi:hypothetical protein